LDMIEKCELHIIDMDIEIDKNLHTTMKKTLRF